MAKLSGSTNYKLSEVRRLLTLVEHYLPLGKDEWERLANSYNANRGGGVAEHDHESLRRKFKVLYNARKPTGVANIPSHVQLAKQFKQAIDDKASVVDMEDGADVDQQEEEYEQDFSFDFEDEEGPGNNTREDADADMGGSTTTNDSMHSGETPTSVGDSVGNADLSELLDVAGVCEGLEAFATPCPPPPSAQSMQRKLRSRSTKKVGQGPTAAAAAAAAAAAGAFTTAASAAKAKYGSQQGAKGRAPSKKESKPKGYATSSNRLGGIDLGDFRDTVGRKRALEDDKELSEASFAKAKRVKAARATAELKKRLTDLESSASNMGGSMFEMMLLMRDESERKAELRRAEEEQRRRDKLAAREARYLADKAEAEERSRHKRLETEDRRRQEKQEAEERARRDKEDARARTQELLLILGALTKKD